MTDTTDKALDALDETYDTQMEVERNPCGAWQAIQIQAAALNILRSELNALRAQLATARADALREAHERLWDKLGGQCRLEACDIVEALIDTPTPSAPSPATEGEI